MKKLLMLLVVLIVVSSSLAALDFKVGPKISVGDFSYRGDDWDTLSSAFGYSDKLSLSFSGGAFINLQIIDLFGVQVEGLFTHSTVRYGTDSAWAQDIFNAISIPIYARANFDLGGFGIYVLAGPRFDYLFDDYSSKFDDGSKTDSTLTADGIQNFYAGLGLGAGVMMPAGSGNLDIGLAYSTTFTKIDADGTLDWYFQGIEVQVGYGFGF